MRGANLAHTLSLFLKLWITRYEIEYAATQSFEWPRTGRSANAPTLICYLQILVSGLQGLATGLVREQATGLVLELATERVLELAMAPERVPVAAPERVPVPVVASVQVPVAEQALVQVQAAELAQVQVLGRVLGRVLPE